MVGHVYYFLMDVVPLIPETYDLKVLSAPSFLDRICTFLNIHNYGEFDDPELFGQAGWFFGEEEFEAQDDGQFD